MTDSGPDRRVVGGWRRVVRITGVAGLLSIPVVAQVLAFRSTGADTAAFDLVYGLLLPVAFVIPGIVVLLRRTWHPVGWLLCCFGVTSALNFAGLWERLPDADPWIVWVLDAAEGAVGWLPMTALLVVFPDGLAVRSRRQRWSGRVVLTVAVSAAIIELFVTSIGSSEPGVALMPSPLPFAFVPPPFVDNVTISVEFIALVAGFVGLVLRYRGANAVARRQYRWVLSAIAFLVVALLVGLVGSSVGDVDGAQWIPIIVAYPLVPLSFMVAILRYRLYEIDRLVSRTVTYSLVVAILAGLYVVAVGVLTRVLPFTSEIAVAASTLTVAAAFRPLLRRVRTGVDRRFDRPRFDAAREIEAFARSLRSQTDLFVVEAEVTALVDRTLHPQTVRMWIR